MSTTTLPSNPGVAVDFPPISVQLTPAVKLTQDEFFDLCQQNPDMWFERTADGELIIMAPSTGDAGFRDTEVVTQLNNWAKAVGKGKVMGPSGGFILPNDANRAPDASWLTQEQVESLTPEQRCKFLPLCPFFLIEVKSPSDSLRKLQAKMEEYLANGCRLGWLIDPETKTVYVYRPGKAVDVLENSQAVSGDPELPGFVLDLEPVWRP